MNILITGVAGFIGSRLCGRLLHDGHIVYGIDDLSTGDKINLEKLIANENFHFLQHDITTDFSNLPGIKSTHVSLIEEWADLDQIYHLASPSSPADFKEIPLQTMLTSALGTKSVLDLAGRYFIPFLLASSGDIYGDNFEKPVSESYYGNTNSVGEKSCYQEGKRFAEALCYNYCRHFEFPLKIVRIFETYGPGMRRHDGRIMSDLIDKARHGEPLRIPDGGSSQYTFCHVDDVVEGLITIMNAPSDNPDPLQPPFLGPVNIGGRETITLLDLAKKIIALTQSSSRIIETPQQAVPLQCRPDITLAQTQYGFSPQISLAEGLAKMLTKGSMHS